MSVSFYANLRQAQLASALIHFFSFQFIASLNFINPTEAIVILVQTNLFVPLKNIYLFLL